jgi:predicted nuclease of predicted toxin-antitoxin system
VGVRFLVDRCAGRRLADWLREQGHDCVETQSLGDVDPGDRAVLDQAVAEGRILVTIDTDFGTLVFREGVPHTGVIRLPDVTVSEFREHFSATTLLPLHPDLR